MMDYLQKAKKYLLYGIGLIVTAAMSQLAGVGKDKESKHALLSIELPVSVTHASHPSDSSGGGGDTDSSGGGSSSSGPGSGCSNANGSSSIGGT